MAGVGRRSPLASFVVLAYAVSWAWMFPFVAAGDVVRKGAGWPTHFPAGSDGCVTVLAWASTAHTWHDSRTGGCILACAVWHGLFNLGTGTAGATGTIQGVTSTFVYVQALLLVGLELRARRRGEASILGPRRGGAPASRRPTLSTR